MTKAETPFWVNSPQVLSAAPDVFDLPDVSGTKCLNKKFCDCSSDQEFLE